MSTLKVNTVQHNTSGFNNVVQFTDGAGTQNGTLCRAWVNFNGEGTIAIRADFNVNTIGDNGTGDYTVNFTNNMPDANYGVVTGLSDISNNADAGFIQAPYLAVPSTSAFRFRTINTGYTGHRDCEYVYLAFFR